MKSRVIRTQINDQGILNLTVKGLSPGEVEVILRIPDSEPDRHSLTDVSLIPLGGYQAGSSPSTFGENPSTRKMLDLRPFSGLQ